jgi:hypothetical protein
LLVDSGAAVALSAASLSAEDAPELLALLGVLDCTCGVASAGTVGVPCAVVALGFGVDSVGVAGVIAGGEFEEEFGGTVLAALGVPVAAGVAVAGTGFLGEGCEAAAFDAEFVAGAEFAFESGPGGTEPDGVADPAGAFAEFGSADAFGFTSAGGTCAGAGTCAAGFRPRFRKGSP